jgi:hypothetical protein
MQLPLSWLSVMLLLIVADSNIHMQTTVFSLSSFCFAFVFFLLALSKTFSSAPGIPIYVMLLSDIPSYVVA